MCMWWNSSSIEGKINVYLSAHLSMYVMVLQIETKQLTLQQIMINQVIYTRKAAINQLYEGLCSLRFNELCQNFAVEFEPLFVASSATTTQPTSALLRSMLNAKIRTNDDQKTFDILVTYVSSLDETSKFFKSDYLGS